MQIDWKKLRSDLTIAAVALTVGTVAHLVTGGDVADTMRGIALVALMYFAAFSWLAVRVVTAKAMEAGK